MALPHRLPPILMLALCACFSAEPPPETPDDSADVDNDPDVDTDTDTDTDSDTTRDPFPPRPESGDPLDLDHSRLFTCVPEETTLTTARLWRLNSSQFRAVAASVAASSRHRMPDPFGGSVSGRSFNNYAEAFSITEPELATALRGGTAAGIKSLWDNKAPGCARSVYRDALDDGEPDDPFAEGMLTDACLASLSAHVYERALGYRPDDTIIEEGGARFRDLIEDLGVVRGMPAGFAVIVGSPDVLFRSELGVPVEGSNELVLSAEELGLATAMAISDRNASFARISGYVQDGSILTREGHLAAIRSMTAEGRHHTPMLDFVRQYFGYMRGESVLKDVSGGHTFERKRPQLEAFISDIIEADVHVVSQLLSASVPTETDGRLGLLQHPVWLWGMSEPEQNHPILRGHFIREHLLCQNIPTIPIDVVPILPERDPEVTTLRENLEVHSAGSCAACHKLMDPLGLPFEQFDDQGRWRDMESGRPVQTHGEIVSAGGGLDGPVSGPNELVTRLAGSERVEQCFVRHLFRYTMGRDETYGDACTLAEAHQAYTNSGGSLTATLESLVTSKTFTHRAAGSDDTEEGK